MKLSVNLSKDKGEKVSAREGVRTKTWYLRLLKQLVRGLNSVVTPWGFLEILYPFLPRLKFLPNESYVVITLIWVSKKVGK